MPKRSTSIRFDPDLKDKLEKEAEKQKRNLSNYIEYLILTHPERKKK